MGERGAELLFQPGPAGGLLLPGGLLQCPAHGGGRGLEDVRRKLPAHRVRPDLPRCPGCFPDPDPGLAPFLAGKPVAGGFRDGLQFSCEFALLVSGEMEALLVEVVEDEPGAAQARTAVPLCLTGGVRRSRPLSVSLLLLRCRVAAWALPSGWVEAWECPWSWRAGVWGAASGGGGVRSGASPPEVVLLADEGAGRGQDTLLRGAGSAPGEGCGRLELRAHVPGPPL